MDVKAFTHVFKKWWSLLPIHRCCHYKRAVLLTATKYGGCNNIGVGHLCNIFVIFQYKGYTINTIHLVLGFSNKFHHNFLGIDYSHQCIIYLIGCLFHHIICFISIKHGIISKVQARPWHLYISMSNGEKNEKQEQHF